MRISRYEADDYMVTAPDGEFVLFKDYAALEARCAGMERERDAAVTSRDGYLGSIEKMAEERDALQAKLAAAVGALRHTCKHLCQWKDACETGCLVSAILAGHAPATVQQEGE